MFHAVCKYTLYLMILIIVVLGVGEMYDGIFPEKVPPVNNIGILSEEAKLARVVNSDWREFTTPDENWQNMRPAVRILDKVCPEAADWVINQWSSGKIIWETTYDGTYAKYDYITGCLHLNESMLGRNYGLNAITLAHEFRHSRQSFSRNVKCVIFTMILREHQSYIIENDAYGFEREVHLAIFD